MESKVFLIARLLVRCAETYLDVAVLFRRWGVGVGGDVKGSVKKATSQRSAEKEQAEEKNRRMPGTSGSRGHAKKMGLIHPAIPAAFLLFEATSGLNFPAPT